MASLMHAEGSVLFILALMLLGFTSRRMVRLAYLALTPILFTAQIDFAVRYSYEKIHTVSLGTARWADLSTLHHIKPSPRLDVVTCADMNPSRLPNDAVCI